MAGVSQSEMRERGIHTVVAQTTIKYIRELNAGDLILIRSGFVKVGEKSVVHVAKMYNADTNAYSAWEETVEVFFDPVARKSAPMPEDLRRRLAAPRPSIDARTRLLGNIEGPVSPELREVLDRPARPASVLLALLERADGPTVLFTERAAHLKDHAGQISLPGGRIAAGETPAEAALREAHEEVGLAPAAVEVVGLLDGFLTGPSERSAPAVALDYVRTHRIAFGLSRSDLRTFHLRRDYVDVGGTHHLAWVQRIGGVEVFPNGLEANVTEDGRLINVSGSPAAGLRAPSRFGTSCNTCGRFSERSPATGSGTRSSRS